MDNGWIKIHRKLKKWMWYKDPQTLLVFINLLLSANHERKEVGGYVVERGQLITSLKSICEDTGLTTQIVRARLDRLELTGEITQKSTNKFRVITICNYDSYQGAQDESQQTINKQITKNQQTNNKKSTTNKKNIRTKENITSSSLRSEEVVEAPNFENSEKGNQKSENTPRKVNTQQKEKEEKSSAEKEENETMEMQAESKEAKFATKEASRESSMAKRHKVSSEEKECKIRENRKETRNYKDIIQFWNEETNGVMGIVKLINNARRSAINARISETSLDDLKEVIRKAGKSSFLKGKNDRGWKASFDWCLQPTKYARILEGCYDDKAPTQKQATDNSEGMSYTYIDPSTF